MKAKAGNIDIIINPEPEMIIYECKVAGFSCGYDSTRVNTIGVYDGKNYDYILTGIRLSYGSMSEVKSIIKEPGRARKIYNRLMLAL